MNKILAIILFPVFWLSMYLYRIVWFDIIGTILKIAEAICLIFTIGPISLLNCLWLIISFPLVLILEIPIGLVVTFGGAIKMSYDIFTDDIDIFTAMKEKFANLKKK